MRRSCFFLIPLLLLAGTGFAMPSYQDVRSHYLPSDAVLLDRHGEVLEELRVDLKARRLSWTRLADISPALLRAVVRSEDRRFYRHHGVDWMAVAAAALGDLFAGNSRGASTITMQLAAMIDDDLRPETGRRSLSQKWRQMRAAREIEGAWSKDEILEAYVNLVTFRGELQGIAAASRGLFDKMPGGLDEAESAVLASLVRSPNAPPERVADRAALLSASLGNAVAPARIKSLVRDRLSGPYTPWRRIDMAPHVARMLVWKGAGSVTSTLDAGVQRYAAAALGQAVGGLTDRNVRDGAVLVADNATGDVLAYVGNSGAWSSARFVDGIRARRQAGSTLKPFLYGLAIEERILTAASLIEDAPLELPTGRGLYRPSNYDHEFRGDVTVRNALASSMNIPAVKTLGLVGVDAFMKKLVAFGFTGLAEPEHYGPSLALGSADITLWDLVNAYRALANGGRWSRLRLSPDDKASPRKRALSRGASFIIADILSDREARSSTFSLESALATRFWTAVKTGTSKDMRDNWCVGFSDRYTVGVWVGNFSGAPMWDVSGVSGAAPVWSEVMHFLHRGNAGHAPRVPRGLVAKTVTFAGGGQTRKRHEWFLPGTEQNRVLARPASIEPRILYPAPGTVIAVDPDIPAELQRVFFRASSPAALVLDGEKLSGASWQPVPGRHRLSLLGADGGVEDDVSFEVR